MIIPAVRLLVLALALSAPAAADPIQVSYPPGPEPYDTIVRIDLDDGHGSGWILDDHRIVTAAHVVDGFGPLTVVLSNGVRRSARLVAFDSDADVAIIRVVRPLSRRSRISCAPPAIGAKVHIVGHALDLGRTETWGRVIRAAAPVARRHVNVFMTDASIARGMSGGPVFSDGRVVGVAVAYVGPQYALGFSIMVPVTEVCRLARIG